ncbi:MAG TPA: hypothetical protein DD490_29430, partial [Acidobacteria bacterium]|nr:hypothetical protein [Acidobacteriota bacterium]
FFADYLRLVEPDSARQMWLEGITFPRSGKLAEPEERELFQHGVVAEVPSRRGQIITVVVAVEIEPPAPEEIPQRLGGYLMDLGLRYGEPVLLSVVHLRGGCPGIRLESGVLAELCGIELVRVYYTCFGVEEARAEMFLERQEPLAWLFASLMRPRTRSPAEHRRACLEKIAGAPLEEEHREILRRGAEAFLAEVG